MYDYEIHFQGIIIGQLKADTDRKALNAARKLFGPEVTVSRVR